jgi:hypothetical protein
MFRDCLWWCSPVSSLTTYFFYLNTYKWWQVNCTKLCMQNLLAACNGMKSSCKFELYAESKSYRYEFGDLPVWISVDLSPLSSFVLVSLILNCRQPPPSLRSNWSLYCRKVIHRFARELGWVSTSSWAKRQCADILWEKIRLRETGRLLNSHPPPHLKS